jgi:hypothetical protein
VEHDVAVVGGFKAKGRKKEPGMKSLELAYCAKLDEQLAAGEILWRSDHQPINLRLPNGVFYRPDFLVLNAQSELEVHEVKGGWFPADNKARTKIAAGLFPFRFLLCTITPKQKDEPRRKKGDPPRPWQYEEI